MGTAHVCGRVALHALRPSRAHVHAQVARDELDEKGWMGWVGTACVGGGGHAGHGACMQAPASGIGIHIRNMERVGVGRGEGKGVGARGGGWALPCKPASQYAQGATQGGCMEASSVDAAQQACFDA